MNLHPAFTVTANGIGASGAVPSFTSIILFLMCASAFAAKAVPVVGRSQPSVASERSNSQIIDIFNSVDSKRLAPDLASDFVVREIDPWPARRP
jgi:hypothetical protein